MKPVIFAVIAGVLLSGCAQTNVKEALDNLSKDCDRHYNFSASSGGGIAGGGGSVTIAGTADCKHEFNGQPAAATPVPAPANP